jgi:hypothetical protein
MAEPVASVPAPVEGTNAAETASSAMAIVETNDTTENSNAESTTTDNDANDANDAESNSLLSDEEKTWSSRQWREALGAHVGLPIERSRPFFEKVGEW